MCYSSVMTHDGFGVVKSYKSQYAESVLNEIAKYINKTLPGWKSMLQEFQIHFAWTTKLKGIESTIYALQPIQTVLGQLWLNSPHHTA